MPLSSTGVFVESGPVYSGFSSTGGSIEFTPPLKLGNSSTTGGRIKLPLSSTGVFVESGLLYSGTFNTGGFSGLLSEIILSVTVSVIFPFSGSTS